MLPILMLSRSYILTFAVCVRDQSSNDAAFERGTGQVARGSIVTGFCSEDIPGISQMQSAKSVTLHLLLFLLLQESAPIQLSNSGQALHHIPENSPPTI